MASVEALSFQDLVQQLADVQARLVEKHWHDVSFLQARLQAIESGSAFDDAYVRTEAPSNSASAQSTSGDNNDIVMSSSAGCVGPSRSFAVDLRSTPCEVALRSSDVNANSTSADGNQTQMSSSGTTAASSGDQDDFVRDKKALESEATFELPSDSDASSNRSSEIQCQPNFVTESSCGSLASGPKVRWSRKLSRSRSSIKATGTVATLASRKTIELEEQLASEAVEEIYTVRELWNIDETDLLRIASKYQQSPTLRPSLRPLRSFGSRKRGLSLFIIEVKEDSFMLHPFSKTRLAWDLSALVLLTYDLITVPMAVFGFPESVAVTVILWLATIYWTVDVVFSLITGIHVDGKLLMDFKSTSRIYLRTWFPIDMIIILPEWIMILLTSAVSALDAVSLLRFLRGSRVIRALRFFRLLRLLKLKNLLNSLDKRIRDDAILLSVSVSKLVVAVLMLAHLMACAWYAVGDQAGGWVFTEDVAQTSLGNRYLYSFQWALARLHPSNMDDNMKLKNIEERLLALFSTILAALVLSGFISIVTNTMADITKHTSQRNRKVSLTRRFCREHCISNVLADRVKAYIDNHSGRQDVRKESLEVELASMLPRSLVMDLRHEAWSPFLERTEFFHSVRMKDVASMRDICHHCLQEVRIFTGDSLFTTGDACSRMLFVVQGSMSYMLGCTMGVPRSFTINEETDDEEVVAMGQWLSEATLWTFWENRGELITIEEGSLLAVLVEPFMKVMKSHENALMEAAIYAKAFVAVLNEQDMKLLSDVSKEGRIRRPSERSHSTGGSSDPKDAEGHFITTNKDVSKMHGAVPWYNDG